MIKKKNLPLYYPFYIFSFQKKKNKNKKEKEREKKKLFLQFGLRVATTRSTTNIHTTYLHKQLSRAHQISASQMFIGTCNFKRENEVV